MAAFIWDLLSKLLWLLLWPLRTYRDVFYYRSILPELYEDQRRPPSHIKAVVIGSGFGGSVTALRLGQAGIETIVLERGQDWPMDPWREIHTYEPFRDGRGLWRRNSARYPIVAAYAPKFPVDYYGGVLDMTEYDDIEVWRGSCVGGGSKVNTAVTLEPRETYFRRIFQDILTADEINTLYDEMHNIYYPRARTMLKTSPAPDDVVDSPPFAHRRYWAEKAQAAGYEVFRPDANFNWDVIRAELNGQSRPSAIIGLSNMGNSNGAKYDTTQNYLKEAVATGFVSVYANQLVTQIHYQPGNSTSPGIFTIDIQQLNPNSRVIGTYSITCEYLFLAAGSIGTSELLVKAKALSTIPNLNEHIGRGWGANGDSILAATFSVIAGWKQTSPCTAAFHVDDDELPVTIENWYSAGAPLDVSIQGGLGMVMLDPKDAAAGYFDYDESSQSVRLHWPRANSETAARAADAAYRSLQLGKPGIPFLAPSAWAGVCSHPLGGVVLGQATDLYGRVLLSSSSSSVGGAPQPFRLYVNDAALIPGTTGAVNPSLTITALTERNIERIIAEDF
jgi:cholesterol oxidase